MEGVLLVHQEGKMKINEVESLVGITKKNIRYYEQEGLLHPDRNKENGYRDYSELDVNILMTIKMLRMMDISIEEIRGVLEKKVDLTDVLKHQVFRLEEKGKSIEEMKKLCNNMIASGVDWGHEDVTTYFSKMNLMEKEGHALVDVKKKDKRHKGAMAIIAAAIIMTMMALFTGLILWLCISTNEIPIWGVVLICLGPVVTFFGVLIALINRGKIYTGKTKGICRFSCRGFFCQQSTCINKT